MNLLPTAKAFFRHSVWPSQMIYDRLGSASAYRPRAWWIPMSSHFHSQRDLGWAPGEKGSAAQGEWGVWEEAGPYSLWDGQAWGSRLISGSNWLEGSGKYSIRRRSGNQGPAFWFEEWTVGNHSLSIPLFLFSGTDTFLKGCVIEIKLIALRSQLIGPHDHMQLSYQTDNRLLKYYIADFSQIEKPVLLSQKVVVNIGVDNSHWNFCVWV